MTDEAFVVLYWERDERAVQESKDKYDRYLTAIAVNIVTDREDAKESVNDSYLAAWNSIPPHRPSVLRTYLGKLTRRIAIDRFRTRCRQKRGGSEFALSLSELEDCLSSPHTPEASLDAAELARAISTFLRNCSEDARRLFIGRYYYLDPLKNVARYCGMSESKAKSLLYRTRCELKTYLQKEGFSL